MHFWLNYCNENHVERIPVAVKNATTLFIWPLHLLLSSDGTRIDEDQYFKQPRNRYRINCLHRGTDPEIVDLF